MTFLIKKKCIVLLSLHGFLFLNLFEQPRLIGNTWLYIHFCNNVTMYLTARFAVVSKRNVQRVTLKLTFNTWPWSVFIMLPEVPYAAVQNENIQWVLLKINPYWKYPAWSQGNSYIFYEGYKFIRFLLNRTYFTSCQFVWIWTNELHLTPPLNPSLTNRTKSYLVKYVQTALR